MEEGCLPQIIYIVIDKIHYRWPVPEVQGRRGNILLGKCNVNYYVIYNKYLLLPGSIIPQLMRVSAYVTY